MDTACKTRSSPARYVDPLSPSNAFCAVKAKRWFDSRFVLLGVALLCFGSYPFFLHTPDGTSFLGAGQKSPCPVECKCHDRDPAGKPEEQAVGVERGDDAGKQGQEAPHQLPEDGDHEDREREDGGAGARVRNVQDAETEEREGRDGPPDERREQAQETGDHQEEQPVQELHGTKRQGKRKHKQSAETDLEEGGVADEEDYGDMDADEIAALKKEKAAEAAGPECRCTKGEPENCNDSLNHKSVSAVCSVIEDVHDLWHLHKWRLSHRQDKGTLRSQLMMVASGLHRNKSDTAESDKHQSSALTQQQEQIATKLAKDRVLRTKLVRKLRDAYGRRFQLPKPFDFFNEMLVDQDEYQDRDEEDAYLVILSAAVLTAIREGLTPKDDYMKPENIFYSLENHHKLREAHDYFRNESLALLPAQCPKLRFQSCAVVGNSGALRDDELGQEIDGHEMVIRTNQAPTLRYEEHVGKTTGMRILNKRWTDELGRRHIDLTKQDASNVRVVVSRANVREFTLLGRSLKKAKPNAELLFLTTRVVTGALRFLRTFRKGMTAALPRHIRGGNTASSGFLAVFLATQFCETVHAYGFSLEECRSNGCSRDYHYFRGIADSPWLRAHPSHSFELEGLVLKAMHVLGMACLKPDPVIGGQCNSRLGGMIGPNGKWKSKRWDLFKAMGRLGLSNSTTLRRRIETYKAEYQAEKVAAAAKESLGEAPQEGGSQQDFQGGTSRPE